MVGKFWPIFPMIGKIFARFPAIGKTFYGNEDSFKGSVPLIPISHGKVVLSLSLSP